MLLLCKLKLPYCSVWIQFFFLMIRRHPRYTRTDTLFPTRRSSDLHEQLAGPGCRDIPKPQPLALALRDLGCFCFLVTRRLNPEDWQEDVPRFAVDDRIAHVVA